MAAKKRKTKSVKAIKSKKLSAKEASQVKGGGTKLSVSTTRALKY